VTVDPTGSVVSLEVVIIARFVDGKITEQRFEYDALGLLRQLQAEEVAPGEGPVLVIGVTGTYFREVPTLDASTEAVSNARLPIVGISKDGQWYQVEYAGRIGWVRHSSSVRAEGDLGGVPVIETVEPGTTPYVKIGASDVWDLLSPTLDRCYHQRCEQIADHR
jgi:hypothetical protein